MMDTITLSNRRRINVFVRTQPEVLGHFCTAVAAANSSVSTASPQILLCCSSLLTTEGRWGETVQQT